MSQKAVPIGTVHEMLDRQKRTSRDGLMLMIRFELDPRWSDTGDRYVSFHIYLVLSSWTPADLAVQERKKG